VRHERLRVLLPLALLNIFVLVAGFVVRDIIESRPAQALPRPPAEAEQAQPTDVGEVAANSAELARYLDDRMSDSGIDEGLSAYVVDLATGEELYTRDADTPAVPASTTKIATAIAALHAIGPDERWTTTVVRGAQADEVVLVGGGDPTLTEENDPEAPPQRAALAELAADTAAALAEDEVGEVQGAYDDSRYSGSTTGPGWRPNYVTEGSVAPVHALMVDGARVDPDRRYGPREDDPPLAAAEAFAERLEAEGVQVDGDPQEVDGSGGDATPLAEATVLAEAESPAIASLVETMMIESENNVAEALAFAVAEARGGEPEFAEAGPAVRDVLAELGVEGVEVDDGSGLSVNNEISAETLVDMLLLAGEPEHAALRYTLTGLPVAHFNGTLTDRYAPQSSAASGAGWIRAKTGTLSGVSTLAGLAADPDGRLVVFAFMANNPMAAGAALDGIASALADCRC
jgi:serine-type D-Ala-D-Ala carboxypeptidase/endopeptidase (penicillin-binding protein 4)